MYKNNRFKLWHVIYNENKEQAYKEGWQSEKGVIIQI